MNRHFVRAILKLIQWYVGSIINIDPIAAIVCSFYCRAANTTHIPRGESFHFCLWLCLCMESMLSKWVCCVLACVLYMAHKKVFCAGDCEDYYFIIRCAECGPLAALLFPFDEPQKIANMVETHESSWMKYLHVSGAQTWLDEMEKRLFSRMARGC